MVKVQLHSFAHVCLQVVENLVVCVATTKLAAHVNTHTKSFVVQHMVNTCYYCRTLPACQLDSCLRVIALESALTGLMTHSRPVS